MLLEIPPYPFPIPGGTFRGIADHRVKTAGRKNFRKPCFPAERAEGLAVPGGAEHPGFITGDLRANQGVAAADIVPEFMEDRFGTGEEVTGPCLRLFVFHQPEKEEQPGCGNRMRADIKPVYGIREDFPASLRAGFPAAAVFQQVPVHCKEDAAGSARRVKHPERERIPP